MTDDGDTKDDVKVPDGDVGDRITKMFKVEEKDTSKFTYRVLQLENLSTNSHYRRDHSHFYGRGGCH